VARGTAIKACAWLAVTFGITFAAGVATAREADANAKARGVIDQAISAIGGKEALLSLTSIRRDMTDNWVDTGQGQRPWTGVPDADHLPVHFPIAVVSFVDYGQRRWMESQRFDDGPGDYAVIVQTASPMAGFEHIRYTDEKPYYRSLASDEIATQQARRFRRHPEGILRLALDRRETLVSMTDPQGRHDMVMLMDAGGTRVSLHFDVSTHLLAKSEIERDHAILGRTTAETLYADYRKVGRLALPFAMTDRVGGIPTHKWTVTTIDIDVVPPPAMFEAPRDFVRIQSAPSEPKLHARGSGVFEILGPYNVMFAVFHDYVLLIEAPLSEAYTESCLDLISTVAPGKPIRAVATHFHTDHIAGSRTLVAHGIPIGTTGDAVSVIRQAASSRAKHAEAPREPQLETLGTRRIFADATQRVEVYDFGPTPHVAQILVSYFPRTKTLHVADLLDTLTPELVIPSLDGIAMIKKIKEYKLDVARIVPMHGVPVTIDDLNRGLAVRARHVPDTPLDARP
jgi:glyoxylase-like metal-dependent hydrolase (beta-lactamase superfamily II)